jgi:hypothetical protein
MSRLVSKEELLAAAIQAEQIELAEFGSVAVVVASFHPHLRQRTKSENRRRHHDEATTTLRVLLKSQQPLVLADLTRQRKM